MVAKSHLSTHYPLMFRPSYEGNVEVSAWLLSKNGSLRVGSVTSLDYFLSPLSIPHLLILANLSNENVDVHDVKKENKRKLIVSLLQWSDWLKSYYRS